MNGRPVIALLARSLIDEPLVRFRPSDPDPDPVDAVTVRVAPLPVTPVIAGVPPKPLLTSVKLFEEFPPVTGSLNVTVHDTLDEFVGEAATRLIELTVGGVLSLTTVTELLPPLTAVHER